MESSKLSTDNILYLEPASLIRLDEHEATTQSKISVEDLLCISPERIVDSIPKSGENSSMHLRQSLTCDDMNVFLEMSNKSKQDSSLTLSDEQVNKLSLNVGDIRDELREFRNEFREMRDYIQMCMRKIDSLEGQIAAISHTVCQFGRNRKCETDSAVGATQVGSSQKVQLNSVKKANPGDEQKSSQKVVAKTDTLKSKKPDPVSDFEGYVKQLPINTVLQDVHQHFIAIKDNDFRQYFNVFESVFKEVLKVMRSTDNYFNRYSSKVQYAGSHYDNLKVGKPNEFDMDVVIRLPISKKIDSDDVKLEPTQAGFVMLKMGEQFQNLHMKPDWESHHKVTNDWCDKKNYLLQSSLRKWIEATVQKALNKFERNEYGETIVKVDDVSYTIRIKKSGPAFTIQLQNRADKKFKLDVDLVPVIEFEWPRWPVGHRELSNEVKRKGWFVVPKPMKSIENEEVRNRHWRLAFQDQEKEVIDGLYNMKPTIRLVKKLRDTLELNDLASYYIKTLFLWESESTKENKAFWKNNFAFLFQHMVKKLHEALVRKSIPYFWNNKFNLIECLGGKMETYEKKVKNVLDAIEEKDNLKLAKSLLTQEEFKEFKIIKSN